ncbi:MAG: ABC transporter substrate-binding protein [Candidatus Dormiibacterota bacterium]
MQRRFLTWAIRVAGRPGWAGRQRRRPGRWFAVLLLLMLAVSACGGPAGSSSNGSATQGGTLTTAIGTNPDSLDPAAQTTTTVEQIVDMMVETLVTIDAQGKVKPLLATSWQESPNGLTYTFTLRKNVKFQDGERFDAAAVKFSIGRLLDPSTFKAQPGDLQLVRDVRVIDADHVAFDLKQRFTPFLDTLTQTSTGIIAPGSVNVAPNSPSKIVQPVGTGPYRFQSWVKDDHVAMTRFTGYWGKPPAYRTQTYKIVPDAAAGEASIRAGQVQVDYLPPPNDIPSLRHNPDLKLILGPSDRTIQIVINNADQRQPMLQKPEVRQALNYAIDRSAIVKNILFGAAKPLNAPMSQSLFGYCKVGSYAYDPSRARKLLQDAGAAGMTLRLISPQGRYLGDYSVAQAVAGELRAVGLNIQLANPMDWATYIGVTHVTPAAATFDLAVNGWAPAYLNANQQLEEWQKSYWPPAGSGYAFYDNPQIDTLVQQAVTSTSQQEEAARYCQAETMVWNQAPWIFLYNQDNPFVVSSRVTGVYGLPNEKFITTWASPS